MFGLVTTEVEDEPRVCHTTSICGSFEASKKMKLHFNKAFCLQKEEQGSALGRLVFFGKCYCYLYTEMLHEGNGHSHVWLRYQAL